jgi:preprotein translocase subunit YajC
MSQTLFLLGSPSGADPGTGNLFSLVLIFVVFFVFMILPQIRRGKEQKKFRQALAKGDKVVLVAGIHGKIVEESETTYTIETEGQQRLKVEKTAVSMESTRVVYPKEAPKK